MLAFSLSVPLHQWRRGGGGVGGSFLAVLAVGSGFCAVRSSMVVGPPLPPLLRPLVVPLSLAALVSLIFVF